MESQGNAESRVGETRAVRRRQGVWPRVAASLCLMLVPGCGRKPAEATAATVADPGTLTLYIPCGMELPFMNAGKAFEAANPGVKAKVVLDNGNILVNRVVEKGEQPDLIASPGTIEMDALVKAGKIRASDVSHFGRYELVLFAPRTNPAGIQSIQDLTKPEVKTIALADPAVNSVGRYTRQALEGLGLWDQLKPKMTFADHPITAYKYVAREKAEASFAYRSCPLKSAPEKLEYSKVRILESVPQDKYDPAYACIAPLLASPRTALAAKFVAYLLSAEGQALLARYDVPPATGPAETSAAPTSASALRVFVPCGMTSAFFAIKQAYEAKHQGSTVDLVFDRADLLTDRILKEGAIPDVHLSIGHTETELLVKSGHVEPRTAVPFGTFRLALATHVSRRAVVTKIEDLAKPEVKAIVLTPPENSSVGAYAKTVLSGLGLWEKVSAKIVYLPTIKDCHTSLAAGKADAEFAYIGCPIPAEPDKAEYSKVVAVQIVDPELYGGATVFASVLKAAPHRQEAVEFVTFLGTPEVVAMLAKVGLVPPGN